MTPIDLSVLDQHERIALSFSGGKDSLAVVYLLRAHLDRLTIYHYDTGDLLPETREIVQHVREFAPCFIHIQGDIEKTLREQGLPSDLVPHSSHPIGMHMGEPVRAVLVSRYDCCWRNLMVPMFDRMRADGNTLLIRGTKAADMNRLPMTSGEVEAGIELFYPIQAWSNDEVFAYLREVGAPISRIYGTVVNSPECARCTAWWGEKRAEYLREHHPQLWADYRARMAVVATEIVGQVNNMRYELQNLGLYTP